MNISRALLLAGCLLSVSTFASEARYIVPVYGTDVEGVNGRWYSNLIAMNSLPEPTDVRVLRVFPILPGGCTRNFPTVLFNVLPHSSRAFGWPGAQLCAGFHLGALELATDHEIDIQTVVSNGTTSQLVEVARDWVQPDHRSTIFSAFTSGPVNLFLINPNDHEINVEYWTDWGGRGSIAVPADSGIFVTLDSSFACPTGCGSGTQPFAYGKDLHLWSEFAYLGAASSGSGRSPVVRLSRPAQ